MIREISSVFNFFQEGLRERRFAAYGLFLLRVIVLSVFTQL